MLHGKKVVVVLPAYHAEKTLVMTYNDIPFDVVDELVLVDDCSADNTVAVAKKLGIRNIVVREKISEYHTGYRAFSKQVLETLPLNENSDDFVFDNQMLAQSVWFGFRIGEISCPTKYFEDASSINFRRSVIYGFGVLGTALKFKLQKMGLRRYSIFEKAGRKLLPGT